VGWCHYRGVYPFWFGCKRRLVGVEANLGDGKMSVIFITGKPRGGKSITAVKAIVAELMDPLSKRFIVTNINLKMDKLAEYLHKNCKHEVNLSERVRVLTDDETGEFWIYEPGFCFEGRKSIKVNRRGTVIDVPDFAYADCSPRGSGFAENQGTLYVIDEVHIFFSARGWQKTGDDCTYFLSQHGKMMCDVYLVTQHPEQVDKALRRLAQEYMALRNLSREPVFGFRLGSLFRYTRMLNAPSSPNPGKFESGFMPLDKELGGLYDTTQGVGIVGGLLPQNEKQGRSPWWLLVPLVLFGLGLWKLPWAIHEALTVGVGGLVHKILPGMRPKIAVSPRAVSVPGSSTTGLFGIPNGLGAHAQDLRPGPAVGLPAASVSAFTFYMPEQGIIRYDVEFSSGEHVTEAHGELSGFTGRTLVLKRGVFRLPGVMETFDGNVVKLRSRFPFGVNWSCSSHTNVVANVDAPVSVPLVPSAWSGPVRESSVGYAPVEPVRSREPVVVIGSEGHNQVLNGMRSSGHMGISGSPNRQNFGTY
jgi:hypothetical protein